MQIVCVQSHDVVFQTVIGIETYFRDRYIVAAIHVTHAQPQGLGGHTAGNFNVIVFTPILTGALAEMCIRDRCGPALCSWIL